MMFKPFVLVLAFAAFGCQTTPQTTVKNVEYVCAASTALLNTATTLNARLSTNARASISHAVSIINPICSQETVPTLTSTANAALQAALGELTTAVQGAQP